MKSKNSVESVLKELAEGLENGSIIYPPEWQRPTEPTAPQGLARPSEKIPWKPLRVKRREWPIPFAVTSCSVVIAVFMLARCVNLNRGLEMARADVLTAQAETKQTRTEMVRLRSTGLEESWMDTDAIGLRIYLGLGIYDKWSNLYLTDLKGAIATIRDDMRTLVELRLDRLKNPDAKQLAAITTQSADELDAQLKLLDTHDESEVAQQIKYESVQQSADKVVQRFKEQCLGQGFLVKSDVIESIDKGNAPKMAGR